MLAVTTGLRQGELLGLTLDTYGQLIRDVNKKAANRLEEAIFSQDGSKMVAESKKGASA